MGLLKDVLDALLVWELDQEELDRRGVEQQACMDERERLLEERIVAVTEQARKLDLREDELIERDGLKSVVV